MVFHIQYLTYYWVKLVELAVDFTYIVFSSYDYDERSALSYCKFCFFFLLSLSLEKYSLFFLLVINPNGNPQAWFRSFFQSWNVSSYLWFKWFKWRKYKDQFLFVLALWKGHWHSLLWFWWTRIDMSFNCDWDHRDLFTFYENILIFFVYFLFILSVWTLSHGPSHI